MMQIRDAHTGIDLQSIRELFEEYVVSLDVSLDFQGFDQEVVDLPGDYSPPEGCLFLALWQEQAAGCIALRKIDDQICEMKRLYVRQPFRGLRIGRFLAESIIKRASEIGCSSST